MFAIIAKLELELDMNASLDGFIAANNFIAHMNKETDSTYLFIDLGERSEKLNMDLQHFHSGYEIFVALDDNEAHIVEGRYLPMRKWDVIFLRPGLLHQSCYERKNGMQKRIVMNFSFAPDLTEDEVNEEVRRRQIFIDFLKNMLKLDPNERLTAEQALQHPFFD